MKKVCNKVALITGASRGIGKAVARGLASDGWSIALCGRPSDKLTSVYETLVENKCNCLLLNTDVRKIEQVQSTVGTIWDRFGHLDLVLNNAGVYVGGTDEVSPTDFDLVIDTNLKGAWNIIHETVPLLKIQGKGYLINVSSLAGLTGFPGVGAYCASKFALRGLNESLFNELVPLGINVTALCPSWVDTEMAAHAPISDEQKIRLDDLVSSIRYLLTLSPNACIKELVLNCRASS